MGAERPPTREELAFEWFVGDAKEILERAEGIIERVDTLGGQLGEKGAAYEAALESHRRELIEAHRELTRAVKDGSQDLAAAGQKATAQIRQESQRATQRLYRAALWSALGLAVVAMGLIAGGWYLLGM